MYLIARIPNRGVLIKSAGRVSADPVTGQLTTSFEETPQLPFSSFTLSFRQGQTSPLVTPPTCNTTPGYAVDAVMSPWATPSQELSVLGLSS